MKPIEQRARDLIARIPSGHVVGVEVGVFRGQFAELLLKLHPRLRLIMVDRWNTTEHQPRHGRTQDELFVEAVHRTLFAGMRGAILRADSLTAAATFDDGSLDFVFIDADHSYAGCAADIAAWAPKVKPGGLLCGHDYNDRWTHERGYGVVRAVDEAVAAHGWTLDLGPDETWYVRI